MAWVFFGIPAWYTNPMQNLGEDILLLAIEQNGTIALRNKMHFALAGSELELLAALRRVDVVKGRIVVIDPTPTRDPLLDGALASMRASKRPPRARDWIARQKATVTEEYLNRMAASGAVRYETRRRLGLFRAQRWFIGDFARLNWLRSQLDAIAFSSGPVDAMQAAFGGLVHAIGLSALLYPRGDGRPARKRLRSLAQYSHGAVAVTDALRARQAAATAAAITAGS